MEGESEVFYDEGMKANDDYVASLLRRQRQHSDPHVVGLPPTSSQVGGYHRQYLPNNSKNSLPKGLLTQGPPPPPPPMPPVGGAHHGGGYGGHRMNRSGELDDILEESSGDDEDSTEKSSSGEVSPRQSSHAISNSSSPASSNSPQGSFRGLMPRHMTSNKVASRSESDKNSSKLQSNNQTAKPQQLTPCYSHKSQDSGFSDSGDSGDLKARSPGGPGGSGGSPDEVDDLSLTNSSEDDSERGGCHNVSHVQVWTLTQFFSVSFL